MSYRAHATRSDVLSFERTKAGPLTGLYVEEFDDEVVLPVDVEAHTITERLL